MKKHNTSENNIRHLAYARGMKLVKYSRRSKWLNVYGPYALAHVYNNAIWLSSLTLSGAEQELRKIPLNN